jgi:hypothetical protein
MKMGKQEIKKNLIAQLFNYFLPQAEETFAEIALKNIYKTFFASK